jgi:hypothetical protein
VAGLSAWICVTCGVQHAPAATPPDHCRICEDERQYVGHEGQRWTTLEEMRAEGHRNTLEELEPNLVSIRTEPDFAIGQHALLVRGPGGNILWDCISYLDADTVTAVRDLGGISAIAVSHPHFYGSCVEWSHTFGAPIHLPSADHAFVMRPDPAIRLFTDEELELLPGRKVFRIGGHFQGSTVLLWRDGASGRGALLTGDSIALGADPDSISVMYSYPNLIPLPAGAIRDMADRVLMLEFDRLYDGWRGGVIPSSAGDTISRSLERYVGMLEGTWSRR